MVIWQNLKTRLKRFNVSESIQRPVYESRVNLHHDAEPRSKVILEGVAIFFKKKFVRTEYDYDGDRSDDFQLFHVISEDSAYSNEIHSMNLLHAFS